MKFTSIYSFVRDALEKIKNDYVSVFAAQAAFFIILSFFPFLMFLLTLLQYLPIRESVMMSTFTDILPKAIHSYVISIIDEIYTHSSGTVISITAITALWSASKGFLALVRGLNSVYAIKETRNYIKLRLISALYTLVFTLLLIASLVLLVLGNRLYYWIAEQLPKLQDVALLLISLRTIVSLTLLVIFFLLMYIFIPNRKTRILRELPGALLSAGGWLTFSYLYSFYIDHMKGFSYTYGSLTTIVLLMLWIYFCMYILFIGAELNDYLHQKEITHSLHQEKINK